MRRRRITAALGVVGLVLAGVPALPAPGTGASLTAVANSAWQTDASVLGLAVAKGKAFVGGRFTRVRPPGAAPGTSQTVRTYLAAFNQTTGALDTGFNHTLNNVVWSIVASPDGTKIYIGGDFTRVDGQVRNRVAAFDATTGALLPNIKPNVSYRVKTIAVGGTSLYFGGSFGLVNGVARNRAAAISTVDGSLLPWNPNADADVYAIDAADDNSKVYLGGTFAKIGGTSRWAVASVNNSSGRAAAVRGRVRGPAAQQPVHLAGQGHRDQRWRSCTSPTPATVVAASTAPGRPTLPPATWCGRTPAWAPPRRSRW